MRSNSSIGTVFLRIAELMSYREESSFKVRAYDRAALTLCALAEPLEEVWKRGALQALPGVGEAIAGKIEEILETGTCRLYERLKSETSPETQALLRLPGLTPKLVRLLEAEFHVTSEAGLRNLASSGGLADLEGLTIKVEEAAQILRVAEALGMLDAPKNGQE